MFRRVFGLLTVLLIVASMLAACAPATPQVVEKVVKETVVVEKEKVVKETVVVEQTKVVEKQVEKVVTATPEPKPGGGTLTIAATTDIDNYDPHWNQLIAYEVLIGHNIFSYLVRLSPTMTIQPDLAQKWDISADGTTYTFHLRPTAKFHNGRAVTAEDVVYSFNRTIEQKMTFASKLDSIKSIEAVDANTVRFVTKTPWAPFLEDIGVIAIVPKEAADNLAKKPIGSGPFRFVEWVPNDHITLEKNPDYDIAGTPGLDKLIIRVIPDVTVSLTNLEAGQVNAVYDVPARNASRFRERKDFVVASPDSTNSLRLIEIAPNRYKPFQDARVRQALAMCLDKENVRKVVYFGEGTPQWSPLPQSSWAYIEPATISYDPPAAKKLLADAGYPNGFEVTVEIVSGSAVMEGIATIWQAGLEQAGVTLKVNAQDSSTWLKKYVARDYQLTLNAMNVRSDPHSMFDVIFKPHYKDANSFPNEEMLALIQEGAATLDQGRRKAIYAKLQQRAVEEMAPVIIIQTQPLLALLSPKVANWTMNAKGDIFFDKVYVNK